VRIDIGFLNIFSVTIRVRLRSAKRVPCRFRGAGAARRRRESGAGNHDPEGAYLRARRREPTVSDGPGLIGLLGEAPGTPRAHARCGIDATPGPEGTHRQVVACAFATEVDLPEELQ